ncbi:hypothetical protein SNEBB_004255 [Seison nebaliae]|nr:hypothetical protein SNEBB_004255 [Seison nebaliae]
MMKENIFEKISMIKKLLIEYNTVNNQSETSQEKMEEVGECEVVDLNCFSCGKCSKTFSTVEEQRNHFKLEEHQNKLKMLHENVEKNGEKEMIEIDDEMYNNDLPYRRIRLKYSEKEEKFLTIQTDLIKPKCRDSTINTQSFISFLERSSLNENSIMMSILNEFSTNIPMELRRKWCKKFEEIKPIPFPLKSLKYFVSYILYSGGYFATAIYFKNEMIQHKTFHAYAIRCKSGKMQSTYDSKNQMGKSCGSQIRRLNAKHLFEKICELLSDWKKFYLLSEYVFHNVLKKDINTVMSSLNNDIYRFVHIPIETFRPNLNEIKRIHSQMFAFQIT